MFLTLISDIAVYTKKWQIIFKSFWVICITQVFFLPEFGKSWRSRDSSVIRGLKRRFYSVSVWKSIKSCIVQTSFHDHLRIKSIALYNSSKTFSIIYFRKYVRNHEKINKRGFKFSNALNNVSKQKKEEKKRRTQAACAKEHGPIDYLVS